MKSRGARIFLDIIGWRMLFPGLILYKRPWSMLQDQRVRKTRQKLDLSFNKFREFSLDRKDIKCNSKGDMIVLQYEIAGDNLYQTCTAFFQAYMGPGSQSSQVVISKVTPYLNHQENISVLQIQYELKSDPYKKTRMISFSRTLNQSHSKLVFQIHGTPVDADIQAFFKAYIESKRPPLVPILQFKQKHSPQNQNKNPVKGLNQMGVTVFMPGQHKTGMEWQHIGGYDQQKKIIQDTVMLSLKHPQVYDKITELTRVRNQSNRPRAILFEGPPGTGKTTTAKIIAQQVQIPLVYITLQNIVNKYFGQSQKRMGQIWQLCKEFGKVIIFIDQIDALTARREESHQASARLLSVLLRKLDGFDSSKDVLLICASNRKSDIDQAMLSRIDLSLKFDYPNQQERQSIFAKFSKQFSKQQHQTLAKAAQGFSGRNILDCCKDAQRNWAGKLIRKEVVEQTPSLQEYLKSIERKQISR